MPALRRVGLLFARFVALTVLLLGAWIFFNNLIRGGYDELWVLAWVLLAGLAGVVGGIVYLLSIDGPEHFRRRSWRLWGWTGMMISAALPHSFSLFIILIVLALIPSLFTGRSQDEATVTSL